MNFALTSTPGSRESVGGLSRSNYPAKTLSRREGGVCGSKTCFSALTHSWARTIRSTLARVGVLPEEDPGTFLFLPFERQSRSVTIVPASSTVYKGERSRIPLNAHLSFFHVATPHFTLFWIKYPDSPSRNKGRLIPSALKGSYVTL